MFSLKQISLKDKKKVYLTRQDKVRELISIGISYKDAMEIVLREKEVEEDRYIGRVFLPTIRNALKLARLRNIGGI